MTLEELSDAAYRIDNEGDLVKGVLSRRFQQLCPYNSPHCGMRCALFSIRHQIASPGRPESYYAVLGCKNIEYQLEK